MKNIKLAVTLPEVQVEKARHIASKSLGFKLPELIRYLLANYITSNSKNNY